MHVKGSAHHLCKWFSVYLLCSASESSCMISFVTLHESSSSLGKKPTWSHSEVTRRPVYKLRLWRRQNDKQTYCNVIILTEIAISIWDTIWSDSQFLHFIFIKRNVKTMKIINWQNNSHKGKWNLGLGKLISNLHAQLCSSSDWMLHLTILRFLLMLCVILVRSLINVGILEAGGI